MLPQPAALADHPHLGYYLKGLVEAHRWSADAEVLAAARLTATGLLSVQRSDGALPGRLYSNWKAAAGWPCLTGNVQVSDSWFYIGQLDRGRQMIDAARQTNAYVRCTAQHTGDDGVRGGVKGSFPVDGDYGAFEFLNRAAKFTIDANLVESALTNDLMDGPAARGHNATLMISDRGVGQAASAPSK